MMSENTKVVTRFAPSPTGWMHIGGIRTALYAYLWARKNNGTFILRIEDTDKEREVHGSIKHIQESLQWLGIDWDFGPDKDGPFGSCIQSKRLETYIEMAHTLIAKGLAYPDPYTPEQLESFRKKAQDEKRPFLFRDHRPETFGEWDGKAPLRFKVPEIKRYHWHDEVRGDLQAGEEALDDFILIKGDGYPTYNFAHIVDDYHMGVTHIMRGDEFISSTPRFLSLYDALQITPPHFVTLPPILRDDKTKKLGKRDGAKDILEYRTEGFLPEAILNFLAFIGWNPGTEQELFTKEQLIESFDIKQIQTHGAVSNEEKLRWLNREHLLKLDDELFSSYIAPTLIQSLGERQIKISGEQAWKLGGILRERISTLIDITDLVHQGEFDYYFVAPLIDATQLSFKDTPTAATVHHLQHMSELLAELPETDWVDPENIKRIVWDYATEQGRGAVLWPLRYGLTGREKSPDPFAVAAMLGKDETITRIATAIRLVEFI